MHSIIIQSKSKAKTCLNNQQTKNPSWLTWLLHSFIYTLNFLTVADLYKWSRIPPLSVPCLCNMILRLRLSIKSTVHFPTLWIWAHLYPCSDTEVRHSFSIYPICTINFTKPASFLFLIIVFLIDFREIKQNK